jgi:hypothetical protein
MLTWKRRIIAGETAESLLSRARFAPMFDSLLRTERPESNDTLAKYLMRFGLHIPNDEPTSAEIDGSTREPLKLILTDRQRRDLTTLLDLSHGTPIEAGRVAPMVADMLETFATRSPRMTFIDRLRDLYGSIGAIDIVKTSVEGEADSYRRALLEAALASLHLKIKDVASAGRHWRTVESLSPIAATSSFETAASVALAEKRPNEATAILELAIAGGSGHPRHYVQLIRVQLASQSRMDAVETLRQGLCAFPTDERLLQLARKFENEIIAEVGVSRQVTTRTSDAATGYQPGPRSKL